MVGKARRQEIAIGNTKAGIWGSWGCQRFHHRSSVCCQQCFHWQYKSIYILRYPALLDWWVWNSELSMNHSGLLFKM